MEENYKILYSGSIHSLEVDVNNNIVKGWVPLGGVAIGKDSAEYMSSEKTIYLQAMIKK